MISTLVSPISSRTNSSASHSMSKHARKSVGDVPGGAAVAEHRVLLVRLVQVAADEVGVLVGLEVATAARSPARARRRRAIIETPSATRCTK